MNLRFLALTSLLATGLVGTGCSDGKESTADKPTATKPVPAKQVETKPVAAKPVADPAPPPAAIAALDAVMVPYEACRSLLAADKANGTGDCARGIAAAAKTHAGALPEVAQPHMAELATAAEKLAATPSDDLEAVRLAFGEVSKPVVGMLTAAPMAAAKYHVFECPMAKGYQRWAQPNAQLANPYMGTKMLGCGSEVAIAPEAGDSEEGTASTTK